MTQQTAQTGDTITRKKGVLLVNSSSRNGLEGFERAKLQLTSVGMQLTGAEVSSNLDTILEHARRAIRERISTLVVGGGDGTIGAVSGLLANSRTALAVLPLGTGNQFARDLQVPINIDEACSLVTRGRAIHVDVGKIDDRHFVNVATAGLSTEIAEQLTNPMKKSLGRLAYVFAAFGGIRNLRPFRAHLETENGSQDFECLQIVIGNGRLHAGPFPILPQARLRAGRFSIYALKGNSKSEFLKFAVSLAGGQHASLSEIHAELAKSGILTTTPHVEMTLDGEIYKRTPIRFETLPSALKVIVPANFSD